jgi:hypothetical protein
MMVPTVHLNGTSREELCLQLEDACDAVRVAITKLRAAWSGLLSARPRRA